MLRTATAPVEVRGSDLEEFWVVALEVGGGEVRGGSMSISVVVVAIVAYTNLKRLVLSEVRVEGDNLKDEVEVAKGSLETSDFIGLRAITSDLQQYQV